nr:MAG TPA: tail protein [Caudoviricetes sp.]
MRIFKYRMRFDTEWIDVSPLINSSDTEIKNSLCTTEYKSVTNTCSFTLIPSEGNGLFYAQIQEKLLQAKNTKTPIDIEISRLSDNVVLFGGYIDNSKLTVTSTKRPDKTSISGNDYIASLLDKKINLNLVYENKSILFIVSNLLKEAGYTGTVDASEALNGKTCKYFVTTDDDDATYRDIIDTLLFEIPGFVLYRNPATRKYEIRQIVGTAEPTRTVNYRLSDKLVTNTKIFDKDGIRIKYPTVDIKEGRPVYVDSVNEGSPAEIPAQHYYPENGDVQATLQEYDKNLLDRAYNTSESRLQNSDLDILYVKNAKLNIFPSNEDNSIFDFPVLQTLDMPSNPVWYPRKAWILLRNKTDKTVNLELMNIEGDVVYKSKINNITLPAKATDPAEYESSYIFDETHASEFARWYYHMQTIATTTSSWTEVNLESELGEKVIVSHKDSAVSQAHVVVQINNVSLGGGIRGYKITAVALSDFGSYEYAKDVRLNSTTKKGIYKEYSEYYNSTSETELVGGTWSQTLYIDPKKTLWIRRVVQYTDGTSYISTPVPSGKDGKPGKDGASSYVHIAYANSEDGTLDFSTSISAGKKYLGQCVDKNADSPTDPTAYKWTKIEGDKGDPAPYARQIYIASPTKPATPTGTADQVPDLWSLQIPARTEKQVIWTSIAVADVKNGQYVYGTWSEPSKYTPDQSDIALIVEWKWGASDVVNPDEENTTIALEDDTILSVNGQAVVLGTNDTSWSKTIPEQPADKPYLWKREWQYAYIGDDGTEHQAGWVYYCTTGKHGITGSYSEFGYEVAGSSIIFAGLDTEGKPTLASFRVSINGDAVAFQRKSFNINGAHNRYFLVAYWDLGIGYIDICYMNPLSETDDDGAISHRMQWVTLEGNELSTTVVDGVSYEPYVLADIKMKEQAIDSVTLLNPTVLKAFEKDYFMSILAQDDIGNIKDVAKALDVERVFEKIAALEAFINKLFANTIRIYGAIYGGGYDEYGKNPTGADGFYLSEDGKLKAVNVTFTTGIIDDVEITNAVLHGDLKSDAITTYKTISASPIDKTFTQDLYSLRDAYSKITKKWQYSPLGSGNTYDGETITEYAVASSVPQPASLTMTSANPASLSDLVVGTGVSREQNVHAGNNYWMINVMINRTSAPIYVDCSCSLYGNMNKIYIEHWDKANVSQKIQHGWAWKGYIFPNEGIGVWTGSSAWWGDRTGAATIKAYASDGLPFEKATKISDRFYATTDSSSSSLNKTFTTYTASNTFVRVIIHKYEISTGSYVLISTAKETKKYTGNSKDGIDAWFNVSGADNKVTISTYVTDYSEGSGDDESSYKGVVNLYGIGIFEYKWNTYADSLFFKYGNKWSVTNCNNTDIDATNWVNANDHPMILPNAGYSTATQSNRLRLSGATVYNYLKPLLANGTEFDYSSKTSSVIINGITISNIQRINYDNDSIMFYTSEGVTYRIYRNTFNINSVYTSIKLSLYPVAEIERAETTTLIPKDNTTYNIGSESKKYSTIYANKFMGVHEGHVNGDASGRTNTSAKVWGAVAN